MNFKYLNLKSVAVFLTAIISLGLFNPTMTEARLNIFDKAKEAIGLGPSEKRIPKRIKPGTPMILANGQRYQIVDIGGGYRKAKVYAERQGGHLAKIDSPGENKLLYNFMIAQGYKAAYFGLSDYNLDGEWEYVDGTKPRYKNWHREHPVKDDPHMVYAMLYSLYTDGKWKSGTFSNMVKVKGGTAFIIEWDEVFPPPPKDEDEPAEVIVIDGVDEIDENTVVSTDVDEEYDVISG